MVFHQATQLAMCHYCQHTAEVPESCPGCGGKLLYFGYGIQRIEDELGRKFPAARVVRMDSDTMTSPKQFRRVFEQFAAGELDILLGTQMVAKGLDFPRVSLVGVASADTSLEINDFRAAERTFQLVVQVAGRAGRAELPGEVVVQTLYADEPAIAFAARHDYDGFAEYELPFREDTRLPPFTRMVRFVVRHEDPRRAEAGAVALAAALRKLLHGTEFRMLGPQPAVVKKIRDLFRHEVQLYCPVPGAVQRAVLPHMPALSREVHAEVLADVDPVNLL
jgi:primosomal protein N' (replication factor Y)